MDPNLIVFRRNRLTQLLKMCLTNPFVIESIIANDTFFQDEDVKH